MGKLKEYLHKKLDGWWAIYQIDTIEKAQNADIIMELLRQNDNQREVYRAAAKRLKELGKIDFDALQSIIH